MTPPARDPAQEGLHLRPMRPLVYRASPERDVASVTMPPVEAWDDGRLRQLAAANPDHVLHLSAPGVGGTAAAGAGATLREWRSAGVVTATSEESLFAWTWRVGGRQVRGVAGAVALPLAAAAVPHEGVRPAIVRDRQQQLAQAGVQVEPIVVLHDGSPLFSESVNRQITREDPLLDVQVTDGDERHRIWSVTDSAALSSIASLLAAAPKPVVADGHHRLRALDAMGSPTWSTAMVLVVDTATSDLSVGSVHRVVPDLDIAWIQEQAGTELTALSNGVEGAWLSAADPGHLRWVLADDTALFGLDLAAASVHAMHGTAAVCAPIARDTCHLHSHLLPAWGIDQDTLQYVHNWTQARRVATRHGGLAVRTSAPTLDRIIDAARAGHTLPHKATSIGPKPRIGLLMLPGHSA
ncbi:MAG: DUF1015 domain-containing protein [Actinomycetota bacterium]|nr:DUF1015 domain-containing protein [Actinomycetota bacterium]